jgi:transposase
LEYFAAVLQRAAADLAERAQALQARQEPADQFKPTELEEWFAVSSTTAQDWLHQWQEQGLLEPARAGQRIRTWRLREPWQQWVLSQPLQRE